ncbi:Transposase [Modestobacter sp. DSM 44400]|uniref:transposase n=1 Tax=Modestobacter sp. DSM 44400 TaxID=1550230 RepID=UPI00089C734A|nr:transposase [Modestobacter sp. DSM 44400]SDY77983.1 Transposase [Modestobacter sp. DSM 44400]
MWNGLVDGDPSSQILTAWIAKEELRALLATRRTGGHRHEVSRGLHRFNVWCADSRLPELERLAGTIEAWWPEVLGFLQTGITNAGTESMNRTVKTAARTAYGFRNLDNQRRRVRFARARGHRRATAC